MAKSVESKFVTVGDYSLNLCSAADLTGKYVKYYVECSSDETSEETTEEAIRNPTNAFTMMMTSTAALPTSPPCVTERNNKDKMYNAIRSFVVTGSLCWHSCEISNGTAFHTEKCVMVHRRHARYTQRQVL